MQHLKPLCAGVTAVLCSAGVAHADFGDQLFKLFADDGAENDLFGFSVGISGTIGIAGARGDDDNGPRSGSAYLFDISDPSKPVQIAKLLPDDGAAHDLFGWTVAISGTTAIVGAHQDSNENGFQAGSAYLFDAATGQPIAKLLAPGPSFYFGYSVALSGATAIVGNRPAYIFDISDPANPAQIGELAPEDDPAHFGAPVAISGATAIVGADGDEDNGHGAGAAYLFDTAVPSPPCPWDLDDSGGVGTGDLIILLGSWGDPYGTADLIELLGNWGPCR